MLRRSLKTQLFIFFGMVDIEKLPALPGIRFPNRRSLIFGQYLDQFLLTVVPDHDIRAPVHVSLPGLDIAAACHNYGVWILLSGAVQHLPRLTVRHIRDCTCIDNIHVCLLLKRHDLKPLLPQKLLHSFRLIRIHLTSEIM